MNAYLLVGLDKQRRLTPMVVINADSIEAASLKLAGRIVEKNDPKYKGCFPIKDLEYEFGRLEPTPQTAPLLMTAMTRIDFAPGPLAEQFLSEILANSFPILLLGQLRQI